MTTLPTSILGLPGVDILREVGGPPVRDALDVLGNFEGNHARLIDVTRAWNNAAQNIKLTVSSLDDDLGLVSHWEASAFGTFQQSMNDATSRFGLQEDAFRTTGTAVKAIAESLKNVNETALGATAVAITSVVAAVAALAPTLGASAATIPFIIAGWIGFIATTIGLLATLLTELMTMLNNAATAGDDIQSVEEARQISFESIRVDVPDPSTWRPIPE
ncbi:MAG TPA: hypothetical protein VGP02_08710 [Mycobacteriales bacterium]|nr:hypothetical protein [Mycobacteriales bacterium]